jgi:hypothetical protein
MPGIAARGRFARATHSGKLSCIPVIASWSRLRWTLGHTHSPTRWSESIASTVDWLADANPKADVITFVVQGIGVKAQLNGELVDLAYWRLSHDSQGMTIEARIETKETA